MGLFDSIKSGLSSAFNFGKKALSHVNKFGSKFMKLGNSSQFQDLVGSTFGDGAKKMVNKGLNTFGNVYSKTKKFQKGLTNGINLYKRVMEKPGHGKNKTKTAVNIERKPRETLDNSVNDGFFGNLYEGQPDNTPSTRSGLA